MFWSRHAGQRRARSQGRRRANGGGRADRRHRHGRSSPDFEGALGSVIGLGLVAVFFTVGLFVVTWAGRISPMAMFVAAVLSYLVKVIAIMITLRAFETTTVFDPKAFA